MLFNQLRTLQLPTRLHFLVLKGFTGIPTVLAASALSTIAFLGYLFVKEYLVWFVIFYFVSAVTMIFDLKLKKYNYIIYE